MSEVLPHESPDHGRWSQLAERQSAADGKAKELARSFVRVFGDNDGEDVLAYLRSITIDKTLPATCSDAELRWAEAQRALTRHILTMIERGRAE